MENHTPYLDTIFPTFPDEAFRSKCVRVTYRAKYYNYNYSNDEFRATVIPPKNVWIDLDRVTVENEYYRKCMDELRVHGPVVHTTIKSNGEYIYDYHNFVLEDDIIPKIEDPKEHDLCRELLQVQCGTMVFNGKVSGVVKFTSDTEIIFTIRKITRPEWPLNFSEADSLVEHKCTKMIMPIARCE